MFFGNQKNRLIERNNLWYVETETGFEGPFDTQRQAQDFMRLRDRADVARVEFMGLDDTLYHT